MFNLGFGEVIFILALALILIGPRKLPQMAKGIGAGLRELRRARDDLKTAWESEVDADWEPVRSPRAKRLEGASEERPPPGADDDADPGEGSEPQPAPQPSPQRSLEPEGTVSAVDPADRRLEPKESSAGEAAPRDEEPRSG